MLPHPNNGIQRRLVIAIILTLLILLAEVAGGLWTGSLALLSDAAHVFMDIFALLLSYLALRLSALPADDRHSYGYHRLEVLAALINGATLLVIAVGIGWEALQRFWQPQPVRGVEMLVIAVVGLLANLAAAAILGGHVHPGAPSNTHNHQHSRDLNVYSAYLHVLGDALSSLGVIAAAVVIWLTGWLWADPLASLLIAGIILVSAWRVSRSALHILLEGVPEGLSTRQVAERLQQVYGVADVHDLHMWSICSGHIALSAHITLLPEFQRAPHTPLDQIRSLLEQDYGILHTTLQAETTPCGQGEVNSNGAAAEAGHADSRR